MGRCAETLLWKQLPNAKFKLCQRREQNDKLIIDYGSVGCSSGTSKFGSVSWQYIQPQAMDLFTHQFTSNPPQKNQNVLRQVMNHSLVSGPTVLDTLSRRFDLLTQTLLVDGYVSRTFNSRVAEEYFFRLLKRNHIPAYRVLSHPGMDSRFFIVDSASPQLPIQPLSESQRVLDRSLIAMGTVVPQAMWSPLAVEDRRRLVGEAELQMPIFFEGAHGKLGISLEACAAGQCDGLVNGQELARLGQRSIINIRIMVGAVHLPVTWRENKSRSRNPF